MPNKSRMSTAESVELRVAENKEKENVEKYRRALISKNAIPFEKNRSKVFFPFIEKRSGIVETESN